MEKQNYFNAVVEIVLIEQDLVRTSSELGELEKDPTTDDPFVGGGFNENN